MDKAKAIVSGSRVHRPLMDETVITEDWKKAREELRETPDTRAALLKRFKEMLEDEEDFVPRTDDIYLMRFLRSRKFDLERAYKLMRDHYKFRAKNPAVFPSPSGIESVLKDKIFNYLPYRDQFGRAIFLIKIGNWNPDRVSYHEFVAAGNIISEFVLDNHVTQINGYIGVWDFKGFTLNRFIPFCSPKNIWLLQCLMQDRFPGRFKIAYCVNCHHLVNTAWNLFKPVLNEKFRTRVKILGSNMKDLHQYVDPSILPEEYGGHLTWNSDEIVKRVLDKEEYFNYNRKFGYQVKDSQTIID